MPDTWNDALRAFFAEIVAGLPDSKYGDGTADITYSENTTLTESVYSRNLNVQPGVVLTISTASTTPIFLYAREQVLNRGTIRANGTDASAATPGGSGAYAGAAGVTGDATVYGDQIGLAGGGSVLLPDDYTLSSTAPGAGGGIPGRDNVGGYDLRAVGLTPPWHAIHTPSQFENRLNDPDQAFRLVAGASGAAVPGTISGAGGEAGGFIGIVAQVVDNWDGVIEATGGDGGAATTGTTPDAWLAATNYAVGDSVIPVTPNGFAYIVTGDAGSSDAGEPTWPTTPGATVVDAGITWTNAGATGSAGGGGGGWGGVVAWLGRDWNGGDPTLTGGEGGAGLGTGDPGLDGGTGFFIKVVDR